MVGLGGGTPKGCFHKGHALHDGDRRQRHPVRDIPNCIDVGHRGLAVLIHLDGTTLLQLDTDVL